MLTIQQWYQLLFTCIVLIDLRLFLYLKWQVLCIMCKVPCTSKH